MRTAPAPLSLGPELPFKYVGGDPSVDLVNTVDWTDRGLDRDRLANYDRLTRWAEGAGVITASVGERLRRAAAASPREAEVAHAAATWLRWVLQRLFAAVAGGEPPAAAALEDFNDLLADALRRLRLAPSPPSVSPGRRRLGWTWRGIGDDLESPLWPVVWSAASLLVSDEAGRIRMCAGEDCGWLYVDRSRNRLRRWCQMETCGTREKSRRRSVRTARADHSPKRVGELSARAGRARARRGKGGRK